MAKGSDELAQAMKEEENLAKYQAYSHLPPYPAKEEDLKIGQMKRAGRRKFRFLKFAKQELKRGDVAIEEVKRIEGMPIHSFYELNLTELARWEKGLYPFGRAGGKRKRSNGEGGELEEGRERSVKLEHASAGSGDDQELGGELMKSMESEETSESEVAADDSAITDSE